MIASVISAGLQTAGVGRQGGVLDARERLVDLERLRHVLSKLGPHVVLREAASKEAITVSAGADSREKGFGMTHLLRREIGSINDTCRKAHGSPSDILLGTGSARRLH